MQMGGCLRTSAARPHGPREMSVILKLHRSTGCYLRAVWSTNSVSWVQQELLVQELPVQELPAGVYDSTGLGDFSSNLEIRKRLILIVKSWR